MWIIPSNQKLSWDKQYIWKFISIHNKLEIADLKKKSYEGIVGGR